MRQKIRILHLEDMPADAELVERQLKKAVIEYEKLLVSNKEDFIYALAHFSPDIILSDHSLPSFDSREALSIVKEMKIRVPFILVTATVSEEYAVSIMKEGAWDYILKDRLQRLPNAIESAIHKYNLEAERRRSEEKLRSSERKYKLMFESNPMPMWMISPSTLAIIDVNDAAVKHYGYSKEEFLALNAIALRPGEDVDEYIAHTRKKRSGLYKSGIWRHKKKDGTIIKVEIIAHDIMYENQPARLILANDITAKLEAEARLARQRAMQQKLIAETSIQAQEKEREEIGKELHDNINQILTATKLYLEFARAAEDIELLPDLLDKSCTNVDMAIKEIRQLSHRLVAPSLGNISLAEAIRQQISNIRLVSSLKLEFHAHNYTEGRISEDVQLMLYRITQEQLNNILKHARAKNVIVELSSTHDQVELTIEDDGIGFNTRSTPPGIGLRNITTRAGCFSAITRIISAPGEGCTLEVSVPVEYRENGIHLLVK